MKAIAALLGKSMRMTMVYAKIANRTVAGEYFAGRQKIFDGLLHRRRPSIMMPCADRPPASATSFGAGVMR